MKAIRICPFDSTTIHTTFSTRMTYDIHTEDCSQCSFPA
jgi:ribosomal protein L37E